jgi:hypothetical protein
VRDLERVDPAAYRGVTPKLVARLQPSSTRPDVRVEPARDVAASVDAAGAVGQ